MTTAIKRKHITGELRDRVAEQVLEYIKRNPGKAVPNLRIAMPYGLGASQIGTVIRQLLRGGAIVRLSNKTYRAADATHQDSPHKPALTLTAPKIDLADDITKLAKDFHWQYNSDSLREFVDWLGKQQ
jgi:hypothetical protein